MKFSQYLPTFSVVLYYLSVPAAAEMSHLDLSGVSQVLVDAYEPLSPLHGFNLLRKGTLEHLHQAGNPEDHTVRLIRNLFQSVDGNFAITGLKSNPVLVFDIGTVGKLLNFLNRMGTHGVRRKSEAGALSDQLTEILWQEVSKAVSIGSALKENKQSRSPYTKEKIRTFAKTLLGSKMETLGPNPKYLPYFPEEVLLSFVWMKGNHRADLLDLFQTVPTFMKDHALLVLGSATRDQWLHHAFSMQDYHDWKVQLARSAPKDIVQELISQPEKAAFLAYSYDLYEHDLPPLISYAKAKHSILGEEKYPDCGETSIRSFFNIILKNGGRLDSTFLKNTQAAHPENHFSKALIDFYDRHSALAELRADSLRDEWSEEVVSRLPGVSYLRPKHRPLAKRCCEMSAGVENVLKVFENLLFKDDPRFLGIKNSEKWDRICKLLSRSGFQLDWQVKDDENQRINEVDTGIELQFSINGHLTFSWVFTPNHFTLSDRAARENDWRQDIGLLLAQSPHFQGRPLSSGDVQFLSWFAGEKNWKPIGEIIFPSGPSGPSGGKAAYLQFVLSLPLEHVEQKLSVVKELLDRKDPDFNWIARSLIASLPEDDAYSQTEVLEVVLKSHSAIAADVEAQYFKTFPFKDWSSIMYLSLNEGYWHVLEALLRRGVNLNRKDPESGLTPVEWAVSYEKKDALIFLAQHRVELGKSGTKSPLHLAVEFGNFEALELLARFNADLNIRDASLRTALHIAVLENRFDMVRFLVEHRADINALDLAKRTPLDEAKSRGTKDMVRYLVEHGAETTLTP